MTWPQTADDRFNDDEGSPYEDFINRLAATGITTGCASDRFCPGDVVTREQMAAFLVRGYQYPENSTDRFTDDEGSALEDFINRLAAAGVTTGCTADRFCPDDPVLREQMATFLVRAEGLTPITPPPAAACAILPADNIWNTRIDQLPVHARSSAYVGSIGSALVHASRLWLRGLASWFDLADRDSFRRSRCRAAKCRDRLHRLWRRERSRDRSRFPANSPVEGGPSGDGDRHTSGSRSKPPAGCTSSIGPSLNPTAPGRPTRVPPTTSPRTSLRPAGWTSADAAGLPIFPGLVRYDEVAAGFIGHALRFTAPSTQRAYVWPARHFASSNTSLNLPPMGQRFRLKSDVRHQRLLARSPGDPDGTEATTG